MTWKSLQTWTLEGPLILFNLPLPVITISQPLYCQQIFELKEISAQVNGMKTAFSPIKRMGNLNEEDLYYLTHYARSKYYALCIKYRN